MLLVIDNYDSFVHNLARYFQRLGQPTHVVRNDQVSLGEVEQLRPSAIVLSPGPGTPDDAGVSLELVREFGERIPMLGVCLGHQTIAQAFGGSVERAQEPMHGRFSWIQHRGRSLFTGLPSPLRVGRYHSLVVTGLDDSFEITAALEPPGVPEPTVMALAHRSLPIYGVQFHPESVLTQHGYRMLNRFLELAGLAASAGLPDPEWDDTAFPDRPPEDDRDRPSDQAQWPTDPISF